jgi:hypothetical protein
MDTLWLDLRRRRERERVATMLSGPGPRPAGAPAAGPYSHRGESAEMRRLKWRIHRFFAQLSREI